MKFNLIKNVNFYHILILSEANNINSFLWIRCDLHLRRHLIKKLVVDYHWCCESL